LTGETEYSILSSIWIPHQFTELLRDKKSTPELEIAHVLFIDIVGYSKLPMDHQREQVEALQQVTSSTSEFTRAKSQEQLISLPTGDGMALVFFGNAEAPVRCAIELTQKLASNPELKLRMGLHTGPVYRIADINANRNVSGGGINIAQRVMDCGDAGHILVSAALASVLKQVSVWSVALHDLGEVQVKHGVRVHIFNLLQDGVGNADTPAAVSRQRQVDGGRANFRGDKARRQYRIGFGLGAATVAALLVATGFGIVRYSRRNATPLLESAKLRSGRFASRPAVALLGFKNLSGKPDAAWISPALSQMLGSQLSAGEQLLIIPSEQVTHGKIDLALPDEQALGPETLSRVRDNLGSDYVVLGSFLDLDGEVRVDLNVQDTAKGETICSISDAGRDNKLPDVAARVGERLRQKLGVAEASPLDAASAKAAQSASVAATRLYSEGIEKLHSFDTAGARDLLERAVREDPNYALAHAALSEAWRSLGYHSKSMDEAKKAMDLSTNLSRENRLAIEAQYRNSIGDTVHEAEIYKSLFTFYPQSLDYGLSVAKSQYYNGQWQEANTTLDALQQLKSPDGDNPRIDHVRSAVALASGDSQKALALAERVELRASQTGARRLAAESLNIQCYLLANLGDPAKAIAACDKARIIYSEIRDVGGEAKVWGQLATLAGRRGDAVAGRNANERQIALLRKMGADAGLSYAMTVAGELSANAGDYSRARKQYGEALALYQKVGEQQGVSSSYGNLGWVYSLEGNLTEAVKNEESAIAIKRQTKSKTELDLWLANLADVLVSKGDVPGAQKYLDEGFEVNAQTQNKSYSMFLHACRARLLFVQGTFEESRREAELALKVSQELNQETATEQRRLMLARLDVEENHPQAAAETLRKSLAYFATKKEQASQVEARAILIQALLTMPFADAKHELAALAKAVPETQDEAAMLTGHLQLARARAALGDKKGARELLTEVISQSQRIGYELILLEAKLTLAEIEMQPGRSPATLAEIEQIAQQADALGLKLIVSKARASLKKAAI
jgi:tetratricopeptide (TPR) repeat protein/class 3 adenylate cyclase